MHARARCVRPVADNLRAKDDKARGVGLEPIEQVAGAHRAGVQPELGDRCRRRVGADGAPLVGDEVLTAI